MTLSLLLSILILGIDSSASFFDALSPALREAERIIIEETRPETKTIPIYRHLHESCVREGPGILSPSTREIYGMDQRICDLGYLRAWEILKFRLLFGFARMGYTDPRIPNVEYFVSNCLMVALQACESDTIVISRSYARNFFSKKRRELATEIEQLRTVTSKYVSAMSRLSTRAKVARKGTLARHRGDVLKNFVKLHNLYFATRNKSPIATDYRRVREQINAVFELINTSLPGRIRLEPHEEMLMAIFLYEIL